MWLSDQLNLTTVIAIAGLVISSATAIHGLLSKRKNIRVRVLSLDAYKDTMFLTLSFENLSQLPIAITNIQYIGKSGNFNCTPIPTKTSEIATSRGDQVLEHRTTYSERVPIQLTSLGAFSGIILFEKLPEIPETNAKSLSFQIYTNRGKAIQKTLELPEGLLSQRKTY